MKHLNRLFRYHGKSIITNMDFSVLPVKDFPEIPNSVRNARTFETRQALDKFCYDNRINTLTIKCAYEPSVHVGIDQRMTAKNAIYGNFGDKNKTPFIVENLKICGKGNSAYYKGIKQIVFLKDHNPETWKEPLQPYFTLQEYLDSHKPISKRKSTNFLDYKWIPIKIPVNSIIGEIITWSTFINEDEVIPYKDQNIKRNHTIKFTDKRPTWRENGIPNGTHAGTLCANAPKDNTVHTYYSVKTVNSAGEIKWIRQNNCQLVNIDIQAEIAAGNIKPL